MNTETQTPSLVVIFDDKTGKLRSSNYELTALYRERQPLCYVSGLHWHMILPDRESHGYPEIPRGYLVPVVCRSEPGGWAWKMWLEERWSILLRQRSFVPERPALPQHGSLTTRQLHLYGYAAQGYDLPEVYDCKLFMMRGQRWEREIKIDWSLLEPKTALDSWRHEYVHQNGDVRK